MNVQIAKDNYSFYLLNFLNEGDELTYDWSLSKSYSLILGKGKVTIEVETREGIGIFDIAPITPITMTAQQESILFSAFLLDDDVIMNELFPNSTVLEQLRASSSHLAAIEESTSFEAITERFSFDGLSSPTTFSLLDLEYLTLGAI